MIQFFFIINRKLFFSLSIDIYVRIDDVFKEIELSAQLVNGLCLLNQPTNRQNITFDKSFVKALIISICTLQAIKTSGEEAIHKDVLKFIRELFLIRIRESDHDGQRYSTFQQLITTSCAEIVESNFH